mgnify:CR=1 FL=1
MNTSYPESESAVAGHPGDALRAARAARGWTQSDVALQIHLTVDAVNQVETGQFDKLPGLTFARGYVRAYAKLLGLDQNQLVHEFDAYTGSNATASAVQNLGRVKEPTHLSQNMLRAGVAVVLVIAVGIGALWWQERSANLPREQAAAPIEHVEVESADGTTQIHPLDELEDQAVQAAQVPIDLLAREPGALANNAPAEQAETDAVADAAPAIPAGQGAVEIRFSGDCWTRIADADGNVLVSALKLKGETVQISGKAPLEVRLGFARAAEVSYNGELVDVAPFIRGQTATLKLGQ